jgi:malate/lactate dehydrogenase
MNVTIIGMGNVGCALLTHLMGGSRIGKIRLVGANQEEANAALLDAISAFPDFACMLDVSSASQLSDPIVVIAAGAQWQQGQTAEELFRKNKEILDDALSGLEIRQDAVIVVVSAPVDRMAAYVYRKTGLPKAQVIGFGGDLDHNRLKYVLARRGMRVSSIDVIGEHGAKCIPVYSGERDYAEVSAETRNVLSEISKAGRPRNLASGVLLAKLLESIAIGCDEIHYVSAYQPEYSAFLTWPFTIRSRGIGEPRALMLGRAARCELEALVADINRIALE